MYTKYMTIFLIFYFENEFVLKQTSANWTINILPGLLSNNITVLTLFRTFNGQDKLSLLPN
jgi:hypothetical protein